MDGSGWHGIRPGEASEVHRWSTGDLAGELPHRSLLSEHSSGEDTSSLETHRCPGRMNDDSSEFPREPHALSILPVRTPDAYDRRVTDRVLTSAELIALADARNECSDSEESVLDAEIA